MNKIYLTTKEYYNDYLVLIKKNDKLITYGIDNLIFKLFGLKQMSYLILEKNKIIKINTINNNDYKLNKTKCLLINLMKGLYYEKESINNTNIDNNCQYYIDC